MKDYFKFLEELKVGDEVLTSTSGDRIYKVIGVHDCKIALSNGAIYDRNTGDLISRKKDVFGSVLELTEENKSRIQADAERQKEKEAEEQRLRLIENEYDELVGIGYRSKRPAPEVQQKVIDFIKSL